MGVKVVVGIAFCEARGPLLGSTITFRYGASSRVLDEIGRRLRWEHRSRAFRGVVTHTTESRVFLSSASEMLATGDRYIGEASFGRRKMSNVVCLDDPGYVANEVSDDDGEDE